MKKLYIFLFFFAVSAMVFSQDTSTSKAGSQTTTQIEEIEGFKMYPNPVSDGNLFITTLYNKNKQVQVYDILGKQVLYRKMSNRRLDVSSLKAGVYILKVFENNKSATRKLVIK